MNILVENLATELVNAAIASDAKIFCAESCTGGLLSAYITSVSGSSKVFEYSIVSYSNEAKIHLLGVERETIEQYSAVSEEVALAMLRPFINIPRALAISITGIAGPTGGSKTKPVGLVYIGISYCKSIKVIKCNFQGDREMIRQEACKEALSLAMASLYL